MEGIFEALLQGLAELVLEISGEIAGDIIEGIAENIISFDFLNFLNKELPKSISSEITILDIQGYKKENL